MNTRIGRLIVASAVTFAAFSAQAVDVTWTGGGADNEWLNAANWSSNPSLPTEGTPGGGDSVFLDTTANHAVFDAADGTRIYATIRVGYNADGRLDVTGGTLTQDGTSQTRIGRGGNAGTLNLSGGTFNAGGIVQVGLDANSTGVVNITGGAFNANRNSTANGVSGVSLSLGDGNSSTTTGTLNLAGGLFASRTGALVGNSGGGVGLFHVNGGGGQADVGHLNVNDNGFWVQRSSGTLQATVDSSGFTLGSIEIYGGGTGAASYVQFDAGSRLDLGFSGAAPISTMSWDLMTFADGVLTAGSDTNLSLATGDAAAGWSFAFIDAAGGAGADTLRVTYTAIPEPASLALIGLGGLALPRRRRQV